MYTDTLISSTLLRRMVMEYESLRLLLLGIFSLLGFLTFVFLLRHLSGLGHRSLSPSPSSSPPPSSLLLSSVMRDMSFTLLRSVTYDFSAFSLIKIGHSGEFFSGLLQSGEKIVIKKGAVEDIEKELELYLSVTDRRYLVPLLGYCEEGKDKLYLVYQFMKEGDLATLLASKDRSLSWIVRLKIAIEVSEALLFFHCICTPPILHNDVKSSSIMVGENYEVRLGSLSKAMRVQGGLLSSDVWHFGMLLMDLISGLDVSGSEDPYAQIWLQKALTCTDRASLLRLIDPSLIVEEDLAQEIMGVVNVAKACLSNSTWLTMKMVRQALDQPTQIGEIGELDSSSSSNGKLQCHISSS